MNQYSDFQAKPSSEKVLLAKIKASKRLMAWTLGSGSVYKIDFDEAVVDSITQDGSPLAEVSSLTSLVAGSFFNDRDNKALHLWTTDSTNPNGKFIAVKFWQFFANVPVTAPFDLSTGKEVYWHPIIKSSNQFGVQLDNEEQLGFAIEGSGQIQMLNDREYWESRFEGYVWERQPIMLYSWSRELPITEAKIIYSGNVNSKTFSSNGVSFKLKDTLADIRAEFPLPRISEISGAKVPEAILEARQRRIYGKLYGFRPTNIDEAVDNYVLPGAVTGAGLASIITGTGTSFLSHFSPDDEIIIDGKGYSVQSVNSDTQITLGDTLDVGFSNRPYGIKPALPKKFINRRWLIAGHECRHPETTILSVDSLNRFYVNDATDLEVGDKLFVGPAGSGEVIEIEQINQDGLIITAQSLVSTPSSGASVVRFCAQNVRINNTLLQFDRDYTIEFNQGRTELVLNEEAEKNVNPRRTVIGSVSFTNGSRTVTGSGTSFLSQIQPNQWIKRANQIEFFEVLSVDSDTQITLRTPATYTSSGAATYIAGLPFDVESDVLSINIIGTTSNGLKSGTLLQKGPEIVKDLLAKVGITSISSSAFDESNDRAPHLLGFAVPETFSQTRAPTVRDLINKVNISIFGSLVQNEDFVLEYNILRPSKPSSALKLTESDILSFDIEASNDRIVKEVVVEYRAQEYNPESAIPSVLTVQKSSDISAFLTDAQQVRTIATVLQREGSAQIFANRWAFLLELATNVIKIKTKLQAARLQVNDVVEIEHEKLFERIGGGKRKFAAVQAISKDQGSVTLELDDLSNTFNRVCAIAPTGSPGFSDSDVRQKAKHGFITDEYGLIGNSEASFGLNLIW